MRNQRRLAVSTSAHRYGASCYQGITCERIFDLSGLDPDTANFYLVIATPYKPILPIVKFHADITGPVEDSPFAIQHIHFDKRVASSSRK